ncbi:MAG: hypothetical protein IPO26_10495 [Saprospiraceae bacterium]|nr:hypothetical protein [Saprospiraceae bacterium]
MSTSTGDCDGDGVTNADEMQRYRWQSIDYHDNTDANDPCDYNAGRSRYTWVLLGLLLTVIGDGNPEWYRFGLW